MKANKHNQAIPPEILEQAQAKIVEVATLLKPYLLALTTTEKQELPKMGPKTLNFVEKSHEYVHENPNLVPPYLEMSEFDTDFADAHGLWKLYNHVRQLQDGIADTQMTAGISACFRKYRCSKYTPPFGYPSTRGKFVKLNAFLFLDNSG